MAKHDRVVAGIHPELKEEAPRPKVDDMPLAAPYDDKPIIKSIGLAKVKGGYCVVWIQSQGDRILDTEIISGPDIKPIALERLKISVVKKIFLEESRS